MMPLPAPRLLRRYRYPSPRRMLRHIAARLRSLGRGPRASGNVLMLHTGRSGSTLLGNMLDEHPAIFWDGEVLERAFHQKAHEAGDGMNSQFGAIGLNDALEIIARRMKRLSGGRIYGVEVQQYHLEMIGVGPAAFLAGARRLGFDRFVILDRHNHLRKIVSHMVATAYARHHVASEAVRRVPSIRIDPENCYVDHRWRRLDERIEAYDRFFAEARALLEGERLLEIGYDADIYSDPHVAYRKICGFLGLEGAPASVRLGKTADFSLPLLIENYDEVSEHISGTRHEWMAPRRAQG